MVGSFAVGKTSLVANYHKNIFSDIYTTTLGVKVSTKEIIDNNKKANLVFWDIVGREDFYKMELTYLVGSDAYVLVADGTRSATLEAAYRHHVKIKKMHGDIPFILFVNKSDLLDEWEITDQDIKLLEKKGITVFKSSAKTNIGIEDGIKYIANKLLKNQDEDQIKVI